VKKTEKKTECSKIEGYLLSKLFPGEKLETTLGDFEEGYLLYASQNSKVRAHVWCSIQIINVLMGKLYNLIYWSLPMFRNYLKISFRNFKRYKGFTFINLAGFTIGMTAFFLIFLYIRHELSYDKFHQNAKDIYRVYMHQKGNVWHGTDFWNTTAPIVAPTLKNDFPEIINAVRIVHSSKIVAYNNRTFNEKGVFSVDPEFLRMFSFPLVKGNPAIALEAPFSMLITEKIALKYFGDENPVGKVMKIDNEFDFIVAGVLKNVPDNSHMKFNILLPFQTHLKHFATWVDQNSWGASFHKTYIQFPDNYNTEEFKIKLVDFSKRYLHTPDRRLECNFHIQLMNDIHLHGNLVGEFESNGDIRYVYIFSAIAVLILIIACLNYINLSTAHAVKRMKEIGLRKVIGADRQILIKQFFGESFLITAAAVIISIFLVWLIIPVFNSAINRNISFNVLTDFSLGLFITSITIITGLVSGSYPALYLSSFQPVKVLKGIKVTLSNRNLAFRNILVVAQFFISISLIIATIVVYRQMFFIKQTNLGFEHEYIINIPLSGSSANSRVAFKNELITNHLISDATLSGNPIQVGSLATAGWEGKEESEWAQVYLANVDYNFIDFYNIEVIEGRKFSEDMTTDAEAFILNETAVKRFRLENPVGKRFSAWNMNGIIIGIMKDIHFTSLHLQIAPLALKIRPAGTLAVKVRTGYKEVKEILSSIGEKYKQFFPGYPFEYSFLDDEINTMYEAEQRQGSIFNYFTFIAVFISCLGLYGLVLFMSELRTKEIGIRKVLGATERSVVLLLSKDFLKCIVAASIISFPVAWYAMNTWLSNFAYRITIGIETFILALLLTVLIAFISTGYRSLKAAAANPVDSIRYE